MNPYFLIITGIVGVITQLFILKYVFVKKLRLNDQQFKIIYSRIQECKKITLNEELVIKTDNFPKLYSAVSFIKGIGLCFISKDERENKAGWDATTPLCDFYVLRWNYQKLKTLISSSYVNAEEIDVFINNNYLGSMVKDQNIVVRDIYFEIENDFKRINDGELQTTSALLYGIPGNGKTTFIRDIAKKYGWNIKYLDLNPQFTNQDIISATSFITDKTIILFEDFDSVFNNRELIKFKNNTEIQFSFDAILNLLDGVYRGKRRVAFFMTCNDLTKIDDAIKNRRSRMRHTINVGNPTEKEIEAIINNKRISCKLKGYSLDNIYDIKNYLELNGEEKTINRICNANKIL